MFSLFGFGGAHIPDFGREAATVRLVSLAGMSAPDARTRRKISLQPARVLSVSCVLTSSGSPCALTYHPQTWKNIPQDSLLEHPLCPCTLCSKGVPTLLRCRCLLGGHESPRLGGLGRVGLGGFDFGVFERDPYRSRPLPPLSVVSSQNAVVDSARRILAFALCTAGGAIYCPLSTAFTPVRSPCCPVSVGRIHPFRDSVILFVHFSSSWVDAMVTSP